MARPKMSNRQYLSKYGVVISAIKKGTPYRTISRIFGIGLSTVQRIANKFK